MLKVHEIRSPDLEPPNLPADPRNCCVAIGLSVGLQTSPDADTFAFEVVTPAWLADNPGPRWGNGLLIVPVFSWDAVQTAIAALLAHTPSQTWEQAAVSLSRPLSWEFENFQPRRDDER